MYLLIVVLYFVFCAFFNVFVFVFCISESRVHFKGVCGGAVSDVRPYLAPVDELIEANYKRTEGGRGGQGEGGGVEGGEGGEGEGGG